MAARDRVVGEAPPPPELGRDHGPLAPSAEREAEELLALAVAVALGRVEQRDPGLERRIDDIRGLPRLEPPAEVVAADTDHGNREPRLDDPLAHGSEPSAGAISELAGDDVEQMPLLRLADHGLAFLLELLEALDLERPQ